MNNWPKHDPLGKERTRNESPECQDDSDEPMRQASPVYWWQEQRHISRVLPADRSTMASMDKGKYSYQLYVRPGANHHKDLRTNLSSSKSAYNIKRVALDRPVALAEPECQLHWANRNWTCSRREQVAEDCSSNNLGGACKQPTTPLNPFVAKTEPNPASDHSSTTCTSSNSTSSGSCSRRDGFDANENNNNNNENNNNNDDDQCWSVIDSVQSDDVEPCNGCNEFLYQLGVPIEIREPKTSYSIGNEPVEFCCKDRRGSRSEANHPDIYNKEKTVNASIDDQRTNLSQCTQSGRRKVTPGYGTYKIIGGRQYREPPEVDPRINMTLPRHLAEYQEYQRKRPCRLLGRYDRTDSNYEMLLPAHKDSTLIKCSLSPFVYARSPNGMRGIDPKCLPLPEKTVGGHDETLQWMMPTFLSKEA